MSLKTVSRFPLILFSLPDKASPPTLSVWSTRAADLPLKLVDALEQRSNDGILFPASLAFAGLVRTAAIGHGDRVGDVTTVPRAPCGGHRGPGHGEGTSSTARLVLEDNPGDLLPVLSSPVS